MGRRIGNEKAMMNFFGRTLTEWVVDSLRDVVDEIVVVARDGEQMARLHRTVSNVNLTCDEIPGCGPIAGLVAGMSSSRGEFCMAVGCDLPFLSSKVADKLFQLAYGYDAAVPFRSDGTFEVLHAVYHRERVIEACRKALDRGERKILVPLSNLNVNYVDADQLRPLDPDLLTLLNINTMADFAAARRLQKLRLQI
jgi:molybdopterin-guanine dinucleotide biosynthesis protein A